ncbi:MAG: hypothetical protein M0C28_15385 [Candidatus Moduliflexus flocculans]|nr:hypothetical protein [Candidatus Moduliflexus flocculans]
MSLPYVFFYLLAFAFAGFMIFSPTGEMSGLDAAFYGLDKLGFLAFPPLLLHFFMIFPLRKPFLKKRSEVLPLLYAPAAFLLLARVRLHVPLSRPWSEATILRTHDGLERLELLHFAALRPRHAGHPGPQHPPGPEHPGQEAAPHHRLRAGLRRRCPRPPSTSSPSSSAGGPRRAPS